MKLVVLCPHVRPDTAPTGRVMDRIVDELVAVGHEVHVVSALPWYRHHAIEEGWRGRRWRVERTDWGSITRVDPFPGGDRRNLVRRAAGFVGFCALALVGALRAGGWFTRVDGVIAMSPPLPLGVTGWVVSRCRRAPLVFNIQDVFPDAAVRTGAITDRRVLAVARWLERFSYHRADAVTVLSDDLADNVRAKVRPDRRDRVRVIPNFVDTDEIRPTDRATPYRAEHGIGDEPVVMYAGNVGYSQSLEMLVEAARRRPDVTFVVNGHGSGHADLVAAADGLANVRFVGYQPLERLGEVLSSADVHVVPLRAGLGSVSVPSKTYSVLAAARPVVAAIDPDTEVPRLLARSASGVSVPPDDVDAFVAAIDGVLADPQRAEVMGRRGRSWVEEHASPRAVGAAYDALLREVATGRRPAAGGRRRGPFGGRHR